MSETLNRAELATALGVNEKTVARMVKAGCPVVEGGRVGKAYRFDLEAVKAWRAEIEAAAAEAEQAKLAQIAEAQAELGLGGGSADDDPVSLSARARIEALQAELLQMKVDQERGNLCQAAEVRATMDRLLGFLSDRLQALPDTLERRAGLEPDAVDLVVRAVDEFQAGLAAELEAEMGKASDERGSLAA